MPIHIYAKFRKAFAGMTGLVDASAVETTGNRDAQHDIDDLGNSILNWKFNSGITDGSDPGATFVAINNAAKAAATELVFNSTSNVGSARFDEMLAGLMPRARIYLQSRDTPANNVLYRISATPSTATDRVNLQVAAERFTGGEFVNDEVLNIVFFPTTLTATQLTTLTQLVNLTGTGDVRLSNGIFQVVDDSGSGTPPGTHTGNTLEYGKNTSAALPVSPLTADDSTVEGQWTVEFPALVTGDFWVFQLPAGRSLSSIINPSLPGIDQQTSWTQDGTEPRLWSIGPAVRASAATTLQITSTGP